jgi:hypothetical protein
LRAPVEAGEARAQWQKVLSRSFLCAIVTFVPCDNEPGFVTSCHNYKKNFVYHCAIGPLW